MIQKNPCPLSVLFEFIKLIIFDFVCRWEKYRIRLGTKFTKFLLVIEIDVKNVVEDKPVHIAVDNLELVDCKPSE